MPPPNEEESITIIGEEEDAIVEDESNSHVEEAAAVRPLPSMIRTDIPIREEEDAIVEDESISNVEEADVRLSPSTFIRLILAFMEDNEADESTPLGPNVEEEAAAAASRSRCCIYKVHNQLREINKKAYEPDIVAIGPYHRKKESLMMREEHKSRWMDSILKRRGEKNLDKYINAIVPLENDIRDCYAEPLGEIESNELVRMMVLDGLFIINLFLDVFPYPDQHDRIFQTKWIFNSLRRDLMLFENQVPFFVLRKLFVETGVSFENTQNEDMLVFCLLILFLPDQSEEWNKSASQSREPKHLLDLIHMNWNPVVNITTGDDNIPDRSRGRTFIGRATQAGVKKLKHLLDSVHISCNPLIDVRGDDIIIPKTTRKTNTTRKRTFIPCATELRDAGVKFEVKRGQHSLFDVTFTKGRLQMARFAVKDETESFWRNLIAYEQYSGSSSSSYVTSYVRLLDCLIDSSGDVKILSDHGILDNWLGDGEAVSKIINKITDSVTMDSNCFRYRQIFDDVNHHCDRKRNRWMAMLRRNYLHSPWGWISIIAAVILLLLTLTQTIFSIIR